ncbi:MAG: hypothetical protein ACREOZ_03575, partial [Gloeomargaritales cyanobacterium]
IGCHHFLCLQQRGDKVNFCYADVENGERIYARRACYHEWHQKAIEKEIVDGEELDFDTEAPVITPGTA